ncbi:MAG: winged helix-turn-helix transcriptional regulator [Elusimicrobia bacterium]|nr:winged helix-turn-helix transcriptional regulator [Elusimicrobiota bacterium]
MAPPGERELKILELLSDGDASTQREVADASGFSLGLVNAVVRRLVKTGHLKIQNLTAKRVRYILTPKGIAEKTRQSCSYVQRTVKTLNTCLDRIGQIIGGEIRQGRRRFVVVGEGDIVNLVMVALELRAPLGIHFERRADLKQAPLDETTCVLDCREPGDGGAVGISVLNELLTASRSAAGRHS